MSTLCQGREFREAVHGIRFLRVACIRQFGVSEEALQASLVVLNGESQQVWLHAPLVLFPPEKKHDDWFVERNESIDSLAD